MNKLLSYWGFQCLKRLCLRQDAGSTRNHYVTERMTIQFPLSGNLENASTSQIDCPSFVLSKFLVLENGISLT